MQPDVARHFGLLFKFFSSFFSLCSFVRLFVVQHAATGKEGMTPPHAEEEEEEDGEGW